MIRDKEGTLLNNEKQLLIRWREHFSNLLNQEPDNNARECQDLNIAEDEGIRIPTPTEDEVIEAINALKSNKAAGSDMILAELIKIQSSEFVTRLHKLIEYVWVEENLPDEWKKVIILPIHKKGDTLECENYRGISLLNTAYKAFSHILYQRCKKVAENILGDYQCGFRQERSTTDNIFYIRQTYEKCWEYDVNLYTMFIDFKTAYDKINRTQLWKAMGELEFPTKLIKLCKIATEDQEVSVRCQGEASEPFQTNVGLKQGDALAPLLFNIALETTLRKAQVNTKGTIFQKAHVVLAYADDIVVLCKRRNELEEVVSNIIKAAEVIGLSINVNKTKIIFLSR